MVVRGLQNRYPRAKRIVAERASQGLSYELLLRGLIGEDIEKRDRSLVSLRYLHENGKGYDMTFRIRSYAQPSQQSRTIS